MKTEDKQMIIKKLQEVIEIISNDDCDETE